jgi:hypothetical protein
MNKTKEHNMRRAGLTYVELHLHVEPCWEEGMKDCFVVFIDGHSYHTTVAGNRERINDMLKQRDKKAKERKRKRETQSC